MCIICCLLGFDFGGDSFSIPGIIFILIRMYVYTLISFFIFVLRYTMFQILCIIFCLTTTWCSKVPRCCLKQTGPTYYTTRTSSYSWSSKSMFFSQCIDSGVISGRPGSTISYHIHCTGLAASYHTAYIVPARQHHIIPHALYRSWCTDLILIYIHIVQRTVVPAGIGLRWHTTCMSCMCASRKLAST